LNNLASSPKDKELTSGTIQFPVKSTAPERHPWTQNPGDEAAPMPDASS